MIRAILFDLGKVILHFNFEPALRRLAKACPYSVKNIKDYLVSSDLEVLYDGGKISSQNFYRKIKIDLGHSLSYSEFKNIWNGIFTPNKQMIRLIRQLKSKYRLVLISNTNEMHFNYILSTVPVMSFFDAFVLSFRLKIRKPDERIYRKAAAACQASPANIFYVDDRRDFTEAADTLKFNTFTYKKNDAELIQKMKSCGIRL